MSSSLLHSEVSRGGLSYIASGPRESDLGLLCVHGWGCQASDFTRLFTELDDQGFTYQAVAVDLAGHGKSPTKVCPVPSIGAFGDQVLSLADELGLVKVVLIGHSMGCRVVLAAWDQAQHAGRSYVKALVFLDGSHYSLRPKLFAFDSSDPRSASLTEAEKTAKRNEMFERMFSPNTPQEFRESCLAHLNGLEHKYASQLRLSHIDWDRQVMEPTMTELGRSDTRLLNLQSTDVDAENQRIPLEPGQESKWMEYVNEKVPKATQFVVEGSAHFPHVDQPNMVANRLIEFVRSLKENED